MQPQLTTVEKLIAVDFDKTIANTEFPRIIGPNEGVKEALTELRALSYKIVVWSCRTCKFYPEVFAAGLALDMNRPVIKEMIAFLDENEIPYDYIDDGEKGKPFADFYIDDKAVRFENNWPEVAAFIRSKTL
jgi:hypothetical protein